jgi:hypothetical protein
LLSDYTEGILDGQLEKEIKEHLSECKECSRRLATVTGASTFLEKTKLFDPGEMFYEEVKAQIIGNNWVNKNYRRFFVPINVKLPLIFLSGLTIFIIISFILVEHNKFQFLSKINIEMFQPQNTQNLLSTNEKAEITEFAEALEPDVIEKTVKIKEPVKAVEEKQPKTEGKIVAPTIDAAPKEEKKVAQLSREMKKAQKNIKDFKASSNKFLYKIFANSHNLDKDSVTIDEILKKYNATMISESRKELDNAGAYFHLYIPQDKYDQMLTDLRDKMKITVAKTDSDRVVNNYMNRVIIWLENLNKQQETSKPQ